MELTKIFFDTNFLKDKKIKNYSQFQFSKNYSDFIDFLGTHDLLGKYKVCIPEIVFEELKKQIIDFYLKDVTNFNEMVNSFGELHNLKKIEEVNYINYINYKIKKYIEDEGLEIVSIPKSKAHFEKIIHRAINKEKPFCGKESESDKGFKDILQWESIIEYAKRSNENNFIFVTKNRNDFDKYLEKEFEIETNKKIEIFYEIGLFQDEILRLNNFESTYDVAKRIIETEIENSKLKDKVNIIISPYYETEINKIDSYFDLIDQGNNYYKFSIYVDKEINENQFNIECKILDGLDLVIEEAIICA